MNDMTLTLSQHDINVLVEGLGQLPLKVSVATFQKVQQQIVDQQSPKVESTSDDVSERMKLVGRLMT